ncbi:MAG: hypothetical protein AUJ52_09465 [Elusimicrobia bacterium CG1_02_63_36]|nr:MAG: hypothetical protein AUJ52_09465 [Elusimicrobia bacterium CG1_02_63_36]PIP82958.1 MAG: endonuclease [Elusimicrobia bacterium CG22_combo_CG10-13_8_21_14_all_63_91]PJA13228.1 MAG: endonuclease [Elusimicrobia bacterium CG_4_10_14_0_2_um_filter_63_34]PJB24460.1 MAG: endonuclease [Elusimicrobia bacterium CG_4_9_14_3_um_filter_62_55]
MTPAQASARLLRRFGPRGWWPIRGRYRPRRYAVPSPREAFEICAGALLTQNTAWSNVERALAGLNAALSPEGILRLTRAALEAKIRPSGYFRAKAKKLKIFARWAGDWRKTAARMRAAPDAREELLSLWGVGPETADSMLLYAFGRSSFVVDAYTRRIGSRIGWFGPRSSYDEIRNFLSERIRTTVPAFNEAHACFVELAKRHCKTIPDCARCPLRTGCRTGRKS